MMDSGAAGPDGESGPFNRETSGGGAEPSPKEMLSAATSTVKQEAASFASSVQDKAKDTLEEKRQSATQTLGEFANAIRNAGDQLAQHDQTMAGRMVKHAGDSLEHLSRSVSEKSPGEMLDAVRNFGRQNPTAFIAGSVLLGMALGRFARSSAPDDFSGTTYGARSAQDFGPDEIAAAEDLEPPMDADVGGALWPESEG